MGEKSEAVTPKKIDLIESVTNLNEFVKNEPYALTDR